jgi:hypothetical protein
MTNESSLQVIVLVSKTLTVCYGSFVALFLQDFIQESLYVLLPARTTALKDWRYIDIPPRVGLRYADGDGYRSKEPGHVSYISIFQRLPQERTKFIGRFHFHSFCAAIFPVNTARPSYFFSKAVRKGSTSLLPFPRLLV